MFNNFIDKEMINGAVPPEVHYAGWEQGMMGVNAEPTDIPPGKGRAIKEAKFLLMMWWIIVWPNNQNGFGLWK